MPPVLLDSHSEDTWEDWHTASRTCVEPCILLPPLQSVAWRVESSHISTHPSDDLSGALPLDNLGYCTSAVWRGLLGYPLFSAPIHIYFALYYHSDMRAAMTAATYMYVIIMEAKGSGLFHNKHNSEACGSQFSKSQAIDMMVTFPP